MSRPVDARIPETQRLVNHLPHRPPAERTGQRVDFGSRRLERIVLTRRQVEDETFDKIEGVDRLQHVRHAGGVDMRGKLEEDRWQIINHRVLPQQIAQMPATIKRTDAPGRIRAIEVQRNIIGASDKGLHRLGEFRHHSLRRDRPPRIRLDEIDAQGCIHRPPGHAFGDNFGPIVGHAIIDHHRLVERQTEKPGPRIAL